MLDNNTLKNTLIWFVFFVRERKQINIWKSLRQYVYSFYAHLVWASLNTSLWMWIMRSPPGKYSMTKQTWSLVWKQPWRLTRNGCLDALIISKILFSLIRLQKKNTSLSYYPQSCKEWVFLVKLSNNVHGCSSTNDHLGLAPKGSQFPLTPVFKCPTLQH